MIGPVPLTIRPVLATPRELELIAEARRRWAEAEAEEQREQHWSGPAGKGGDVRPASTITFEEAASRVAQGIFDGGGGPEDLDRAASLIAAKAPDDRVAVLFSRALRSAAQESREAVTTLETWTAEQAEKESMDMNAMTERLIAGLGEAYREDVGRRWPSDHSGKFHEPLGVPKSGAYLPYPTATEPEPVDEDRKARGAREPALSDRLRGLAREVQMMAGLSADSRTKNRLMRRAGELQRMALRQYSREMENDYSVVGDDADAELNRLVNDAARDANGSGDGDGDHPEFRSFDSWADPGEDRAGSEQRAEDDVADQRAELDLGEDVPQGLPPRPGRRVDEDENPGHADEPRGLRRNRSDNDLFQRLRKGKIPAGSGRPRGGDRFGGERKRYSGTESVRESGDMTATLLNDLDLWYRSGLSWF